MIKKENITPQEVSWVKSDSARLSYNQSIKNLYFPETTDELVELISSLRSAGESFDVIGHSSNTLFLSSYSVLHLICTKKLRDYTETPNQIICECGVPVSSLSMRMIEKGYVGFEGLIDLPGTIAAAVYGNCGCCGCSVNSMLHHIELLTLDGSIRKMALSDLKPSYRSTVLKTSEISVGGVILKVCLNKVQGNASELMEKAHKNHEIRKAHQPSGANNLGTTFNGGQKPTAKGYMVKLLQRMVSLASRSNDSRVTYPKTLKLLGKGKFAPYTYYWNRYMFLDEKAHDLFDDYYQFLKTLYKDVRLEIEIRK